MEGALLDLKSRLLKYLRNHYCDSVKTPTSDRGKICTTRCRSVYKVCAKCRKGEYCIKIRADDESLSFRINCESDVCVSKRGFILRVGHWMTLARVAPGLFDVEWQYYDVAFCANMFFESCCIFCGVFSCQCKAHIEDFCKSAWIHWWLQGAICADVAGHICHFLIVTLGAWGALGIDPQTL